MKMDTALALHTKARRHCLDRYKFWAESYRRFQAGEYASGSERADSFFPRYLVWQAILDEVERIDLRYPRSLDDLRSDLVAAGGRAQTTMTLNPKLSTVACASMVEERSLFEANVEGFCGNLGDVEPLEERRVLGTEELRQVWDRLAASWNVTGDHWWPLREANAPATLVAFHTDWFEAEKVSCLRELLISHGVELVWEVREFREWGCERSVISFSPGYTGEEGYWTSASLDWIVYASHESSVTLAGKWLVAGFCQHFPAWERATYQGPMSTQDRRGTWVCRS